MHQHYPPDSPGPYSPPGDTEGHQGIDVADDKIPPQPKRAKKENDVALMMTDNDIDL